MLQPANRLTLVDAMRPPVTFRLESAMAVTFTLDLRALLAAPAAMALTESDGIASDGSPYEPIEILHALRSPRKQDHRVQSSRRDRPAPLAPGVRFP